MLIKKHNVIATSKERITNMLKKILLVIFLGIGFFMHNLMRICVGLLYKSDLINYYKPSKSFFYTMGFTNIIPFLIVVCIVMIKNKELSEQSMKKRNFIFYSMGLGLITLNTLFYFDYWRQIYMNTATSTISLSIPIIMILSIVALPLFYQIGKIIYTLNK